MLDVTDRLSVIIGGGAVALRKTRGLIEAGATRIRMVSPDFQADIPALVEKITARFKPDHLTGAGLAFAATDSREINDAIVREARRRGIWVSRADSEEHEPGDFTLPAISRQGPVVITVATAGAPALATMIRDEIAARFDPRWRMMAEAMQAIRPALLTADGISAGQRREVFRSLATPQAMEILMAGGIGLLWESLVVKFPPLEALVPLK